MGNALPTQVIYNAVLSTNGGDIQPVGTAALGNSSKAAPSNHVHADKAVGSAGTYAYPTSVTTDAGGRISSITAGSAPAGGTGIYGDGSDGDYTVTSGTTLTLGRDMFYDNLTVDATGIVATAGYRLFCRSSCTIASGGRIQNNGGDGTPGVNPTSSGSGGTGGAAGTLAGGADGRGGGISGVGNNGNSVSYTFAGSGGAGGQGSWAGGTGGIANAPPANYGSIRALPTAILGSIFGVSGGGVTMVPILGGAGGGSGAGDNVNVGGASGGGGGFVVLAAKQLTLAGAGAIRANGGAGCATTTGNPGGGGGGGGGMAVVVYSSKTGAGTATAAGGAGGAGHGSGTAGAPGAAGTVIELVN